MIADNVNEHNVYGLYAQAYTLRCPKLMHDICDVILKKYLNPQTCVDILVFAVRFENDRLKRGCQDKIKNIFKDIKPPPKKPTDEPKTPE